MNGIPQLSGGCSFVSLNLNEIKSHPPPTTSYANRAVSQVASSERLGALNQLKISRYNLVPCKNRLGEGQNSNQAIEKTPASHPLASMDPTQNSRLLLPTSFDSLQPDLDLQ